MKIFEGDLVTWEPLVIRLSSKLALPQKQAEEVAHFVRDWFDRQARESPEEWKFAKEWTAEPTDDGRVLCSCDLMPETAVNKLAEAVRHAFPDLSEMHIGEMLQRAEIADDFGWHACCGGKVLLDGRDVIVEPFAISLCHIRISQFEAFINATGYAPVPDQLEFENFTIEQALSYGPKEKTPMFGVTHDDAQAYCEWAGFRLPTAYELAHFFMTAQAIGKRCDWCGLCWTSTASGLDHWLACDGPYNDTQEWSTCHRVLHRHHYLHAEFPGFRVIR
jgi:hypothetical protein